MKPFKKQKGVVDFIDETFQKKQVRGLLKKRAKQYDSDSDREDGADGKEERKGGNKKPK
jgi:hypothetical protein|tara:strand:+ start:363 stop:539 length:177 start_codon:yes stop_codon:yes gene_type:complete